jgi:hypothetical protein
MRQLELNASCRDGCSGPNAGTHYDELIANLPSRLDWLGLVQMILQWICEWSSAVEKAVEFGLTYRATVKCSDSDQYARSESCKRRCGAKRHSLRTPVAHF